MNYLFVFNGGDEILTYVIDSQSRMVTTPPVDLDPNRRASKC